MTPGLFAKVPVCIAIFQFAFNSLYSQNSYPLKDSIAIFTLLDRADELSFGTNYELAMDAANSALQISKAKKIKRGEGFALLKIADILYRKSDIKSLGQYDSAALRIGLQLKDDFLTALAYYQLGVYFMSHNSYTVGLNLFDKALAMKFENDQSAYTALVYNDIGYVYGMQGVLEKSVEWYLKAIAIYEKKDDISGLAQTLNNISVIFLDLGNRREAIEYAKKSIAMREKLDDKSALSISYNNISQMFLGLDSIDQAIKYQQLGLKYAEASGLDARMAQSYISMSLLLNRQKKNAEALEYEKKAISLLQQTGNNDMLARRYIAAAILSKAIGDSSGALSYHQKAFDLSTRINNKYNLRDIYLNKAIFYKDYKDFYNAYENYKKYILYRDSILNTETNEKIADIQARYETEKKDNEISRLNASERIKELQIEKQQAVIVGNVLEAEKKQNEIELLSSAKELQDLKIKQQDEELEKQILLAKNNEQQLMLAEKEKLLQQKQLKNSNLFRNLILAGVALLALLGYFMFNRYQLRRKIKEQEALLTVRNNIAKDLHDEIGSTLTSIKILSEVSGKNLNKDQLKTSSFLQKITEQSAAAQQGISDIVWAVKPENDKLENMVIRMREYVAQTLEAKNIHTVINIDEQVLGKTLDMNQRRDFFLVFKEAVNNIAKYAEATEVQIKLARKNNDLQLQVMDNGKGFDAGKTTSSNGLKNMKARAEALKGSLDINTAIGKGSEIILTIPTT